MASINYDLFSELIFTNDTTFTDIDTKKAKMMLCTCKIARNNKNILLSFDIEKAKKYFKQIRSISIKKGRKEVYIDDEDIVGYFDLDINEEYKTKIANIIANIFKETPYVVSQIKRYMIIEQKKYTDKILKNLKKIISIIESLGIDMENITDDDRYKCLNDEEYVIEKYNRSEIITIYKYNAYFINLMFNNNISENDIIKFISTNYFHNNWYRIPIIFTKSFSTDALPYIIE